jgi:hypothetical protein
LRLAEARTWKPAERNHKMQTGKARKIAEVEAMRGGGIDIYYV